MRASGSDDMLLFSSDYPHWHFDGDEALPAELPDATVAPCSPATRSAPIPGSEARHGRAPRGAPRRPPGSDLELMRRQYLDARNVEYGILAPLFPTGRGDGNPEFAAAIRAAVNDWQRDRWTRPEPRLKASIVIPYQDPPAAVAEIERCAGDPDFAQVLMLARTSEPLGSQRYWPIFIKAVEVGFAGRRARLRLRRPSVTGAGWPSCYIDETAHSAACQAGG